MRRPLLAMIAMSLPASVSAQDTANNPAAAIDDLIACRTLTDSVQRLACLDRAAAMIADARKKRQIVILDREGVRAAKRSVFGFSLPNIKLFGKGDDEPEVTEIDDEITEASDAGYGKWTLHLKAGTIWQTTEARINFDARTGDKIHIKAGMLGSYTALVAKERAIRIKRIR